ncbi:hypothetical protein [Streptosporangium carneum]|uniref:Uncharacterized protein n=1 Tax=Streptosporangium carneum TaxID=47481 RepID=A0A9W6I3R6_9ACTN|nr:hypothetical protein [Streptosporangium carneum]GLK10429.1 hypothetical protein GCM10017600_38350 [Streptosporangium carneum]
MSDYQPYSYVTASIHEGNTRLSVSFHTADLSVMALNVHGIRPYLCFGSTEGELSISTTGGGPVTAADLALAREIADAATRYRDECERLHANRSPDPDQADENAA